MLGIRRMTPFVSRLGNFGEAVLMEGAGRQGGLAGVDTTEQPAARRPALSVVSDTGAHALHHMVNTIIGDDPAPHAAKIDGAAPRFASTPIAHPTPMRTGSLTHTSRSTGPWRVSICARFAAPFITACFRCASGGAVPPHRIGVGY